MNEKLKDIIDNGKTALGIELGSTRIKSVLIDGAGAVLASGGHTWENKLENGIWTYSLGDVWAGLQESYRKLAGYVKAETGDDLTAVGSIGISGMMHGYLAFDENDAQIAQFRTWRNTITGEAARILSDAFHFNVPQRWSVAHLYQAILNLEPGVPDIRFLTTLAGYAHWKLTGEKVLGIGDASGMFPVDCNTKNYDGAMMGRFGEMAQAFPWRLGGILPEIRVAGQDAGTLTEEGALLIDPSGKLRPGVPMCPPEGDMQTGMAATNSITPRTGNISAGTSINGVIVLEKMLKGVYPEIDTVTTPDGNPVALIHGNNCTSEIDEWAGLIIEASKVLGAEVTLGQALDAIFEAALSGDPDCGGLVYYNYLSGETLVHLEEGRPLLVRKPDASFNFANFARAQLYSAIALLRYGMDILRENEHVELDSMLGHGGYFKAKGVGQKMMAAALGAPVSVMETSGEGGAWGIALLALYMRYKAEGESLVDFLNASVFAHQAETVADPCESDMKGFEAFMKQYIQGLPVVRAALDCIK